MLAPFPANNGKLPDPKGIFGVPAQLSLSHFPANMNNAFFLGLGGHYNLKGGYSDVSEILFEQHYLGGHVFCGYQVPHGKVKPYFGAEATLSFLLNPSTAFRTTTPGGTSVRIVSSPRLDVEGYATEIGMGVFVGTDIAIAKQGMRLELKYHYGHLPLVISVFTHAQHSVQFLAKFRLTLQDKPKKALYLRSN
jgi:hypothetical protein